ncbi:uncharacterized protein LOC120338823 [Styela clava]
MVEKCPQYSALPSPGLQYNTCYKHVPLSLSTTPPAAHPSSLGGTPTGIGLMTAPNAPRFGTVIPSRIFVGGIDFKTSEDDLQTFFSTFGAVRDTKIIRDRAEVSKGYGFVTFSSTEEVNKVMDQEDCLYLNGKKLNIGPAIRKQQIYLPKDIHVPGPVCSWVVHPGGYASYTNANGITYFLPTPQLLSTQVMPSQQPYVMAYNGAAAPSINGLGQPMTQYAGFSQGTTGTLQPIHSNMTLPWSPTQTGSCGQILTSVPTLEHNQPISMIQLASTNSAPGNVAPSTRTPANANQTTPVVAAAVPQTHIQIPTSYVCSPVPTGQQSAVPMRFAPHPGTQVLHGVTEQGQPVMHSVNYGQQMFNTPTLGSKPNSHVAAGVGDMATITMADGNVVPAYSVQQAVYPTMGLVGPGELGAPVHYTQLSAHQASDVLTPPPTPETQSQNK